MTQETELPIVTRLEDLLLRNDTPFGYHDTIGEAACLIPKLADALKDLEPFLDAIVCYASSIDEHEPNRIVVNARKVLRELDSAT